MKIDLSTAVLLPIDMQQAFDAKPWPQRFNHQADTNGAALLAAWRGGGGTIIHVRHDSVVPGSNLAPGAAGNAFRPGFVPEAGEAVVSKSVNAAFIGTDLDLRLRRLGAKQIICFGIATDMCVSTTIRVGANMGWNMVLVEDACDCFDLPGPNGATIAAKDIHAAHVATLGFEFCAVVKTQEMLSAIQA